MSTDKTQPVQIQTQDISTPIFQIGISRVGWKPTSSSDRGLVMGMRYLWAEYLNCWQWQYYIALDSDSPSSQWTQFDWGWQDDLEPLPTSNSIQVSR